MNTLIGLFAKPIGSLLAMIYGVLNNYGLSIIVLTLLVRLCLLPMYSKQMNYQAKMNELNPKLKEIQTKYAADREMMNEKTMELYKEMDVSPTSGCLPMLIQMPVIMGLFALLRNPLDYMTQPHMIAAVHESFIWISDLCQPDSWILPIAAGLSTYFTYSVGGAADAPGMKGMKYFFPIFIFLMGRSFPAGLALYWAIGNVFMIGQSFYFNEKKKKIQMREDVAAEIKAEIKKEKANKQKTK